MPVEGVFRMKDGTIALTSDGHPTLWLSSDEALTWKSAGGAIPGNHPGVTQLNNGSLYGLTRGVVVQGKMPIYRSIDRGKTWDVTPSPFPHIGGGQRLVLIRLKEGPLLLSSFAKTGMTITDSSGNRRKVRGLYAAVSLDEGKTWPYKRLVSDDGPGTAAECTGGG